MCPLANNGAIWISMWITMKIHQIQLNTWAQNDKNKKNKKKMHCLPLEDARELTYSLETW